MKRPLDKEDNDIYIDYKGYLDLPDLPSGKERALHITFTKNTETSETYVNMTYEVDGLEHEIICKGIDPAVFHEVTDSVMSAQDKINMIKEVKGNITINDGVAWLPDGTSINL